MMWIVYVIIAIFLIFLCYLLFWVCVGIKPYLPMAIDDVMVRVTRSLALTDAKEGLSGSQIYTPTGREKASFRRRVDDFAEDYLMTYQKEREQFIAILEIEGVINEKGKVKKKDQERVRSLFDSYLKENRRLLQENVLTDGISPEEFFSLKRKSGGDFVGVYIIRNITNNKHYVGQAKRILFRVNQHFTGKGNGDVYADYKNGDDFRILLIKLSESGYSDIDKLEKDKIREYNAFYRGYNKTEGNG